MGMLVMVRPMSMSFRFSRSEVLAPPSSRDPVLRKELTLPADCMLATDCTLLTDSREGERLSSAMDVESRVVGRRLLGSRIARVPHAPSRVTTP